MARQTENTPTLCHHKGRHLAYVTLGGRERYLGRWDTVNDRPTPQAQAAYHRIMGEWIAAGRSGAAVTGHCGTIAELCEAYLAQMTQRVTSGKRARTELYHIRTIVRAVLADADRAILPPAAFTPKRLRAVRRVFIDRGLARTTVNQHTARVRMMCQWGGAEELIDPLIYDRLRCVKGLQYGEGGRETEERMPALWDVVEAVRPYVSRQVWAMVELQWHTGMRSQNVVEITAGRIEMGGDVWFYTPVSDKVRRRRKRKEKLVIALGPRAQAVLSPWLRFDPNEYLFSPAEADAEFRRRKREQRQTPVWPSHAARYRRERRGRTRRKINDCYTPTTYRNAIERACRRAFPAPNHLASRPGERVAVWHGRLAAAGLLEDLTEFAARHWWTPHQLRHAFSTRAGDVFDGEMDTIAAALGHKHVDTTLLYAHLNRQKAAKVALRIG